MLSRSADDLRAHQQQPDGLCRIKPSLSILALASLVPSLVRRKRLEERRRIRVIDRHRRHRLWWRDFDSCQTLLRHVMFDRIQHHRANVGWRRLQEIAEEIEIMLDVPQASRARNEAQESG